MNVLAKPNWKIISSERKGANAQSVRCCGRLEDTISPNDNAFVIHHLAASVLNHRRESRRPFCSSSRSSSSSAALSLFFASRRHWRLPDWMELQNQKTRSLALFLLLLARYAFIFVHSSPDFSGVFVPNRQTSSSALNILSQIKLQSWSLIQSFSPREEDILSSNQQFLPSNQQFPPSLNPADSTTAHHSSVVLRHSHPRL